MENLKIVDQKPCSAREAILAHPELFAAQGTVVAGWRHYRGRSLGPFYRLVFREAGHQKSIYIGKSNEQADQIRTLLTDLRRPNQARRAERKLRAELRTGLRRAKLAWELELQRFGLYAQGYEIRGWRRRNDG